jgi:hypothetical protein
LAAATFILNQQLSPAQQLQLLVEDVQVPL